MKQSFLFFVSLSLLQLIPGVLFPQSKIHGLVSDANGNPIAAATVLLKHSADSVLVKGTVTDNAGYYSFDDIAVGSYMITSSHVGFSSAGTTMFQVQPQNENIDRGVLKLEPLPSALTNVTVTAKRPLYELKPDRLTINVESSITAAGSTALQVLERSPGVTVSRQNNTIAMMGKEGVNLLINGKLSNMPASAVFQMLDGMSAGNIDRIELITTPPANFDAEGKAGYINVVLKKNDNFGTNGSFSGTLGYGKGWATGASLNFNHRKGKVNIFGSFSINRDKHPLPINTYNRITNNGDVYDTYANIDRTDTAITHSVRMGLDYQLTPRTVVGILLTSNGRWYRQSEQTNTTFDVNGKLDTLMMGSNSEVHNWYGNGINLNLQHSISKNESLSFDATYMHVRKNQPFHYFSRYYDGTKNFIYDETIRTGNVAPLNFWIGNIDYKKKLSEKFDLETGLKGTLAEFTNVVSFEKLNQRNWLKDPSLSSIYTLKENYSAAYISLNFAAGKKTTIKGGLRYEYTNSNLGSEREKNIVDRHYGKLFPTFFLSHKLNEKNSFNISFSRRITRPTFNDLAPFTYYINRNNVYVGNPALQPAISNAVSAAYTFKKYFLQISYTHEDNTIENFQPTIDSAANKQIKTTANLANQKLLAVTLSVPVTLTDWWTMQYNITGNWQQVNGQYLNDQLSIEQKYFTINMTQAFTLPKDFSIELTGSYKSKNLWGITVYKPLTILNFGIRKKLSPKDNFYFSVNNILHNLSDIRLYTNMPEKNLVGDFYGRWLWRTFKLTYTRSFGNRKLKASRTRKTGAEEEKGRVQY